jgi:hypothetical protein
MQRDCESPGFAADMLYEAVVGESFVMVTLPAVIVLLSLLVVLENAENAPVPATAPTMPTIANERRVLRRVEMTVPFLGRLSNPGIGSV